MTHDQRNTIALAAMLLEEEHTHHAPDGTDDRKAAAERLRSLMADLEQQARDLEVAKRLLEQSHNLVDQIARDAQKAWKQDDPGPLLWLTGSDECRELAQRIDAWAKGEASEPESVPVADGWESAVVDALRVAIEEACGGDIAIAHTELCGVAGELALESRGLTRLYVAHQLRGLAEELED